jgi:hypothetical protein
MTKKIAERSRRAPGDGKRTCRVAVRYTPGELALVEAAATREGLVTAAWLGNAGLALASPHGRRAAHASQEELDRLVDATEKVRRVGVLLNQVVATMHSIREVRPVVEVIAVRVWEKVQALDDAAIVVSDPALRRSRKVRRRR